MVKSAKIVKLVVKKIQQKRFMKIDISVFLVHIFQKLIQKKNMNRRRDIKTISKKDTNMIKTMI